MTNFDAIIMIICSTLSLAVSSFRYTLKLNTLAIVSLYLSIVSEAVSISLKYFSAVEDVAMLYVVMEIVNTTFFWHNFFYTGTADFYDLAQLVLATVPLARILPKHLLLGVCFDSPSLEYINYISYAICQLVATVILTALIPFIILMFMLVGFVVLCCYNPASGCLSLWNTVWMILIVLSGNLKDPTSVFIVMSAPYIIMILCSIIICYDKNQQMWLAFEPATDPRSLSEADRYNFKMLSKGRIRGNPVTIIVGESYDILDEEEAKKLASKLREENKRSYGESRDLVEYVKV